MKFEDLTNQKFHRLTALEKVEGRRAWTCVCECGNRTVVVSYNLKNGHTKSCGCLMREVAKRQETTHGLRDHELYNVWCFMKARCDNKSCKSYHNYGGRGITYAPRWKDVAAFIEDMHPSYISGLQLDRIDNSKGYSKENCRWVTSKVNQNNKRVNVFIEYMGYTRTIAQWSEELGIRYNLLYPKLRKCDYNLYLYMEKYK